ncbi:nudC domain-containing protein 1 [Megalopta genalis]|uniref:nudC domain-containing protein 1 n=1 Tax=Megalopta genalis TaxID=115081 RepID=UPI00144387D0|nr:nudC domain-containing protein 1 [Megalopta genalis]
MTKVIELRPKKSLTNSKFEKYQLCTDEIPVATEIELNADVRRLELTLNRDSLLETHLFAFHNHLFKNPYDASCWFIDDKWLVWRLRNNGTLEKLHQIHDTNTTIQNVLYNPSIVFASSNFVVISDGGDCVNILSIEDKEHIKVFPISDTEPGVILDARYVNATSTIIVALCNIKNVGEKKFTNLILLTYTQKNTGDALESFEFSQKEALKINGAIEYVHIEDTGKYFHSICQDYITFQHPKVLESVDSKDDPQTAKIKIPRYCWSQDEDSLTIWIKIDKEQQKDVKVHVTPLELSVTLNGIVLIQGQSQHRLDEHLTTWKYEDDTFKLELFKHECGLIWSELIKGDTGGEHLSNEALAAEIHSRLAHLCTDQTDSKQDGQPCIGFNSEQLEECDLEGKDNLLQRIDLIMQKTTHLAMLGTNNHVLFTYKTKSGQAICLRHDNDSCLWVTGNADDTKWDIEHYYTFPGFGYVEASKRNKKFCVSPDDGSYVAILEHTRYIFLYKRPELTIKVEKQWIVDLGTEALPIMGATATNKYLIILTKNKLYRLDICF